MARSIRRQQKREQARRRRRTARVAGRTGGGIALAIGAGALLPAPASAATIEVENSANAGPGSLRAAISAANGSAENDVITFDSSLSGDTITLTGVEIEIAVGAGSGNLELRGPGADELAVSGNDDSRVFAASGDGALSLSGLTLTQGYAAAVPGGLPGTYTFSDGGAINSSVSNLTISDSRLTANEATDEGGAIHQEGSFELDGLTVSGNTTRRRGGGISATGSGAITDTVVSSNVATGRIRANGGLTVRANTEGAGMALLGEAGGIEVGSSTISGNEARDIDGASNPRYATGGGVHALRDVAVSGSTIEDNSSDGGAGGAFGRGYGDEGFSLDRVTIADNAALLGVGGVQTHDRAEITRSTITGNTGVHGGILSYDYGGASPAEALRLSNSTVSGNTANGSSTTPGDRDGYGGGLYVRGRVGATIESSTIADNAAETGGGGVFSFAGDYPAEDRDLSSTIVAGNVAAGAPSDLGSDSDASGVGFSAAFSLIEDPGSADLESDPSGSNIVGADPDLGPLAANGGPTQTRKPANGSPVIDQGTANGLTIDQRGDPRTRERAPGNATDGTDIGSVELGETTDPASPETPPETPPGAPPGAPPAAVDCNGSPATIASEPGVKTVGTPGPDVIVGTGGSDVIDGRGGDDQICAGKGADRVSGGGGDDAISGDLGADRLLGRSGSDELFGKQGKDRVRGGGGADLLQGGGGGDRLEGRGGADALIGRGGSDRLHGNAGRDALRGGPQRDLLWGGRGDDTARGARGRDELRGARGADDLRGARGADELFGGAGDDLLRGGKGRDACKGGSGDNTLRRCSRR